MLFLNFQTLLFCITFNINFRNTTDSFIGYRVIDEHHGEIGEITDVDESTINVLLQIDHNGEELLLPAAEELILSADHENKTLAVSVPEGLLDL